MTIAVTGHRPPKLGGYSDAVASKLLSLAEYHFEKNPPGKVITGMALGWDQAVAFACYRMGIPFIAAVPFLGQESIWPESSRVWYMKLLGKAESVVVVCPGGYDAKKMTVRDRWMVDQANSVVALFDGSVSGTGHTVRYALGQKKTVVNLWDTFQGME